YPDTGPLSKGLPWSASTRPVGRWTVAPGRLTLHADEVRRARERPLRQKAVSRRKRCLESACRRCRSWHAGLEINLICSVTEEGANHVPNPVAGGVPGG